MLTRIWNLVVKEFIQLRRDRLLTVFIVSIPLVQLILLARSTGRGFNHLPMAVLDLDDSQLSRRLITVLDNTRELDVRYYPRNPAEVRYLLDVDRADLALVIPAGLASELDASHSRPQIQIIADGSNNIIGSTALSAAQGVIEDFARDLASRYGAGTADSIDLR
ncbi:MAG: ABC transporter permease, partial [Anaerolineae bacterium]